MRYAGKTAVDDLSLQVARGSITAVLGPNGAGKTTTLETCEGYRRPQEGRVRVLGLDPVRERRELLPRIGVMLQGGGAWSGVRAEEMLRHVAALHAHPVDHDLLVERLGLAECGRTPYRRLSGGQQQRLGLAMALVGRPEIVFVDEPTAGMDPQARRTTWELLEELRGDGVTVVLTTHYMDEAEQLTDRLVVMDKGLVVAEGSPLQLIREHSTREVAELRFGVAEPGAGHDRHVERVADLAERVEVLPDRLLLYTADGEETLAKVHERGLEPVATLVRRATLEDVFLRLTGRTLVD